MFSVARLLRLQTSIVTATCNPVVEYSPISWTILGMLG